MKKFYVGIGIAILLSLVFTGYIIYDGIGVSENSTTPIVPVKNCWRDNICEIASYNETTMKCERLPVVCENDDNACTETLAICDLNVGCHKPIICNDNNPCTKDNCDPNKGCVFEPFSTSQPRLKEDCQYHVCENGIDKIDKRNKVCFDGDPCSEDFCEKGKCLHSVKKTKKCIAENEKSERDRADSIMAAARNANIAREWSMLTCEQKIARRRSAIEECGSLDYRSDDGSKKYSYRYSGGAWVCWYHTYNNSWDCTQFFN